MGLLNDRVAIITGAGNGIGRATAKLFAREGAAVVVNDLGAARDGSGTDTSVADAVVAEIREAGGEALPSYESVATPEGARKLVSSALERFGRVDILINNAGILRDKTLLKMDVAMWDSVIEVHLRGTFLCTQAAALAMKDRGAGGRIVNTTSISGLLGNFGQANYSAAKAGIVGLTRTASIEFQRYNITVNVVAPLAKTRMTDDVPMFEKIDETLSPEHVAPAHLYLASDLCGAKTGLILAVAGAKLSVYRLVESPGKFKESNRGVWSAQEIAEHWDAISKV